MTSNILLFPFLLAAAAVLSGCNPRFDAKFFSQSSSGSLNARQIEAFRTTFYKFAKTQGCVKCHESNVNPHFAAADVNIAYRNATGFRNGSTSTKLIEFDKPGASLFIDYAGNAHCGDTPCSDPDVRPVVQNELAIWAATELALGRGGPPPELNKPKFYTGSLRVPASIPTIFVAAPAVMRFPLSQLKPTVLALQNAVLEVEIQMVNEFEYRLKNPKIAGNTAAVAITDLSVFIKPADDPEVLGTEDTSLAIDWHDTAATAAIFALPATLPPQARLRPSHLLQLRFIFTQQQKPTTLQLASAILSKASANLLAQYRPGVYPTAKLRTPSVTLQPAGCKVTEAISLRSNRLSKGLKKQLVYLSDSTTTTIIIRYLYYHYYYYYYAPLQPVVAEEELS